MSVYLFYRPLSTLTYQEFCDIREQFRDGEIPADAVDGVDAYLGKIIGEALLSRSPQTISRVIEKYIDRTGRLIGDEVSCTHDPNHIRVGIIARRILRGAIWYAVELLLAPENTSKKYVEHRDAVINDFRQGFKSSK